MKNILFILLSICILPVFGQDKKDEAFNPKGQTLVIFKATPKEAVTYHLSFENYKAYNTAMDKAIKKSGLKSYKSLSMEEVQTLDPNFLKHRYVLVPYRSHFYDLTIAYALYDRKTKKFVETADTSRKMNVTYLYSNYKVRGNGQRLLKKLAKKFK